MPILSEVHEFKELKRSVLSLLFVNAVQDAACLGSQQAAIARCMHRTSGHHRGVDHPSAISSLHAHACMHEGCAVCQDGTAPPCLMIGCTTHFTPLLLQHACLCCYSTPQATRCKNACGQASHAHAHGCWPEANICCTRTPPRSLEASGMWHACVHACLSMQDAPCQVASCVRATTLNSHCLMTRALQCQRRHKLPPNVASGSRLGRRIPCPVKVHAGSHTHMYANMYAHSQAPCAKKGLRSDAGKYSMAGGAA